MEPRKEPDTVESLFKYGIDYQLHLRKGKQYISQKAPADIAFMYADGRYRLSTGTPDKALAKSKAQQYLRKIEEHFDRSRKKLDPFIEGLRPYLESRGVPVVQWYKEGLIECELYREQTLLWRVTGGNYEFNKRESIGAWDLPAPTFDSDEERLVWEKLKAKGNTKPKKQPKTDIDWQDDWEWDIYFEDFVATEYSHVAVLVTVLGGYVPTYLQHLCCQLISYSSSLHEGYDEPEILLDQIVKSVPNALTLDTCALNGDSTYTCF